MWVRETFLINTKVYMKNINGCTYIVCDGLLLWGSRNDTQYRPMLSPLTQASPFPIVLRFKATGSSPIGASKNIFKIFMYKYRIKERATYTFICSFCTFPEKSSKKNGELKPSSSLICNANSFILSQYLFYCGRIL